MLDLIDVPLLVSFFIKVFVSRLLFILTDSMNQEIAHEFNYYSDFF